MILLKKVNNTPTIMGRNRNSMTSYFLHVFLRLLSKVTCVCCLCFHLPELTSMCCSFDYPGMFCFDTRDESCCGCPRASELLVLLTVTLTLGSTVPDLLWEIWMRPEVFLCVALRTLFPVHVESSSGVCTSVFLVWVISPEKAPNTRKHSRWMVLPAVPFTTFTTRMLMPLKRFQSQSVFKPIFFISEWGAAACEGISCRF